MKKQIIFFLNIFLLTAIIFSACSKESKVIERKSFIAENQQSVFEQTKGNYSVEYDSSTAGVFLKAIDGISQTKTSYWLYYINNQSAMTACDKTIPEIGDTIEWRLVSGY